MKHDFEERKQKRIANAKKLAAKNETEAESLYASAKEMADFIPFGQPILVGHHSEKSDRRYRNKINSKFEKSFEKSDKAAYYADKVHSIESNNAIFSDDPDALAKLRLKLQGLRENQDFMKMANKYIKAKDKAGFLRLKVASESLWVQINTPNVMGQVGFASYSLRNNNAVIRQVTSRITLLERQQSGIAVDEVIGGIRILENREAGRLQICFEGKPAEELRKLLKSSGFRWSPVQGAWQRHISRSAILSARQIAGKVAGLTY